MEWLDSPLISGLIKIIMIGLLVAFIFSRGKHAASDLARTNNWKSIVDEAVEIVLGAAAVVLVLSIPLSTLVMIPIILIKFIWNDVILWLLGLGGVSGLPRI